ncbi:MAG: DUF4856 domain-containing protein [Bacteroidota bacterium]
MNRILLLLLVLPTLFFLGCDDDDDTTIDIDEPTTYAFVRDGASTVSYSGQTDRIGMATELISAMKDPSRTEEQLDNMFQNPDGVDPFADADLNASSKSVRSKTAASQDFYSSNTVEATAVKEDFDSWIAAQVAEVFPKWNELATPGQAGQIADGSSTRYVNGQGLEYDQMVNKSLIGALMGDQLMNNYLGVAVLDAGSNVEENDNGPVADGKNSTTMEHKWDEAYGYLYGGSANGEDPRPTVGDDDKFLNKYLGRVDGDTDFMGISEDIYGAFKLGRAAIVAGDYKVRDEQAAILREKVSEVIGVRAVYYLQAAKTAIEATPDALGGAFHDLSEAYGFIYSLQFTRKPNSDDPYFTRAQATGFIDTMLGDGANGLWDVTPATLQTLSEQIAAEFDFTVAQAAP